MLFRSNGPLSWLARNWGIVVFAAIMCPLLVLGGRAVDRKLASERDLDNAKTKAAQRAAQAIADRQFASLADKQSVPAVVQSESWTEGNRFKSERQKIDDWDQNLAVWTLKDREQGQEYLIISGYNRGIIVYPLMK